MCRSLFLSSAVLVLCLTVVKCQRYIVPDATLELLVPRGLKISIPDIDKGVSLVAFHININEEFYSLEHGQWAQDIIKKREGRWTYIIPEFKVKQGDTIYYWVYVIVDGLGYQALDKSYKVTQAYPHGSGPPPPPPPPSPTPEIVPDKNDEEPEVCQLSMTSRNGGLNTCRGDILLDKKFDNLDGWSHQVHIGGSQPDDEFTVFTKDSGVSYTDKGNLFIRPKLLEEKYSEEFVRTGSLNLEVEGCTSSVPDQCSKTGVSYLILPPVMGARITSKGSFSFRYGIIEITAKLPRGDWIVPELWLEPLRGSGSRSGRVVLALSRGNSNNNRELEAGVIVASGAQLGRKIQDSSWSQDFHTFKLIWTRDVMEFFVDGELITRLPPGGGAIEPSLNSGRVAPFDKEYYITLGLHVAGNRDFPDDMPNKPWKNSNPKRFVTFWGAKNSWKPTWDQDAVLRVQSIKVTAI